MFALTRLRLRSPLSSRSYSLPCSHSLPLHLQRKRIIRGAITTGRARVRSGRWRPKCLVQMFRRSVPG